MQNIYIIGKRPIQPWKIVTMSITQGRSGFPFLAAPVYNYLCTGEYANIDISTMVSQNAVT